MLRSLRRGAKYTISVVAPWCLHVFLCITTCIAVEATDDFAGAFVEWKSFSFTLRKDETQDIRADQEEQEQEHAYSVSLPHEVFAGIWEKYPNVFRKCYSGQPGDVGHGTASDLRRFWKNAKNLDQWKCHPLKDLTLDELEKVIPIVLHGDETPITSRGKIWSSSAVVFSWSSMLSNYSGKGTKATCLTLCGIVGHMFSVCACERENACR